MNNIIITFNNVLLINNNIYKVSKIHKKNWYKLQIETINVTLINNTF